MNLVLTIPELGENDIEGTVVNIPVTVGEMLLEGQTLLEVETDKVVVEVPATQTGTLNELLIGEGDTVKAGAEFARLSVLATKSPDNKESTDTESSRKDEALAVKPPPSISAGNSFSRETGTLDGPRQTASFLTSTPCFESTKKSTASVAAGPGVRRLAREIGVDITQMKGSGPRGRISRDDVKREARVRIANAENRSLTQKRPLPDLSEFGGIEVQPLTGIQRATAANMVHAVSEIPHAWLQEKIDITFLEKQRQQHKQAVKAQGGNLTLTAILVKAVAKALVEFPIFNSCFDDAGQQILYRQYVDVGVAVDTDSGLVVPSVRGANEKSLTEISIDTTDIALRARERKLSTRDLQGAGFTISNLGGMGLCGIFPIVNWPQVAILGVAKSSEDARMIGDQWQSRLMMPVTLGFDHRVINGADGARFLGFVKQLLESPFALAL